MARRGAATARCDFTPERMARRRIWTLTSDIEPRTEDTVRFVIFTHSLVSDWNHGNAHFLRGVATELVDARPRRPDLRAARRLEPAAI